jgi:hypothetical protein
MKTSPTQRSLAYLRKAGWTACVVEKWIPPRGKMKFGVRIDAFGFGDLLACKDHSGDGMGAIALVQTTSLSNMVARRTKMLAIPEFQKWKDADGLVLLHGWAKKGPRGKRKTWQVVEEFL